MNKLTKLLSVFVIAGAIGTGVAGAVGCNNGNGDGDHTEHNWSYTQNDNGTHSATCDGCDEKIENAAHVYDKENDTKCICGAAKPVEATGVTIDNTETEIFVNSTLKLTATVTPANATSPLKWEISKGTKFATINETTGEITGVKAGQVTVRVTAGTQTAEKTFDVSVVPLTGAELNKAYFPLKPGETYDIAPVFTPANASNKKVVWTSSNTSVATVDENGKITAVADGKSTISGETAEGAYKLSATVEVNSTFVEAEYSVNITDKFEGEVDKGLRRASIVTVPDGTQVRNRTKSLVYENKEGGAQVSDVTYEKSVKLASGGSVVIKVPAPGTLTFHVQNGSSGVSGWILLNLLKTGGDNRTIRYSAADGSPIREVVVELEEAGEYKLFGSSGTSDVYYVGYSCRVKDTPLDSIAVTFDGVNEYYVGQEYSYDAVQLDKIFAETGRTQAFDIKSEGITVDYSEVNMNAAGVYPVTVKYNDGTKDYVADPFYVTVYAVESIRLGTDKIVLGSTNAGNTAYINQHLRELYMVGDELSEDGLTVIVNGAVGEDEQRKTQSFIIKGGYTLTGFDSSSTGKQAVTVTLDGTTIKQQFEVYVIAQADLSAETSVSVNVDATVAETAVGSKSGDAYQFQTIHQALEFLENCKIPASAKKTMTLAAGTFNEKVEITVPNLTIIGSGTDQEGEYTMIEWDSLYGIKDDSGFTHTTDSTATFNVRDSAVGFKMKNVIVSNYFNCVEHFDERMGVDYGEHRALAMLIQADKVVIENCTLLGYQDTLELFTGRQRFKDCLILGVTDFIFGTNNTTYFEHCEIRGIKHAKSGQIGYLTAFKGLNKDVARDGVTYGAIFDDCDFTAETDVANGWAIGRTWGINSTVMVMNSRLGGYISKAEGARYINMNGAPKDAQFTEYNNTGAGAITASQTGVTVLDKATADKYADFTVIFGTTNGNVTYADTWDGGVED